MSMAREEWDRLEDLQNAVKQALSLIEHQEDESGWNGPLIDKAVLVLEAGRPLEDI